MPRITQVRPVLLSAPYADLQTNGEVLHHLMTGYRTCGLVEITLEDGTTGLGEGYLAVFAPQLFVDLIELLAPVVIGRDIEEYASIYRDMLLTTGYWSLQGAAQHAVSAMEIALCDCRARVAGIPVYKLFNDTDAYPLKLYASGGDSIHPEAMAKEFEQIAALGIDTFKIRARKTDVHKARWCLEKGMSADIRIAIDMTQNLAIPSQSVADVLEFLRSVEHEDRIAFVEEAFGPDSVDDFPALRQQIDVNVAGGEIVTTYRELASRIRGGYYDIAQPDATVMGGIQPVVDVFNDAIAHHCKVYVHCWGGPVGMLANYHAAIAGGGEVAEWPMPAYPLREALLEAGDWDIRDGCLYLGDGVGLGARLTPEIEQTYPFREDAIYHCLVTQSKKPPDSVWQI